MAKAPFLTADEFAVFRCDGNHGTNGGYDGSAFIARGPVGTFGQAFEQAFAGYDYDGLWSVTIVDPIAGRCEDVTDAVKTQFPVEIWERWEAAENEGRDIAPRMMTHMIAHYQTYGDTI